jgi:hypothetical protein
MPSTDMITERLDALEASLPTIPAKVLHFQRAVAAKTYDNYTATMGAVADSYKSFFDTALTSSKTVTEQARAAGEQFVTTLTNGIKTVAGQTVAQSKKVSDAAEAEVTGLVDSAIDAVEDAPSTGTPYEQWTKAELVERAKELSVVGPTRMSKKELIKALRAA